MSNENKQPDESAAFEQAIAEHAKACHESTSAARMNEARERLRELYVHTPSRGLTRDVIQQKAIDCGFQYWRAPDAHGVTGTNAQAVELLQDLLGVEVEITEQP